ncbi:hypothetical protein CASFOL_014930 [Castilleja foliolosa]|uniref:Uncharacterized protein n=1 Tax=Castilleja foliolosa TaxID=1961234 RepID=A0ABD3DGA5_9LAMI
MKAWRCLVKSVRARVAATEHRGSVNEASGAASFCVADNMTGEGRQHPVVRGFRQAPPSPSLHGGNK